MKKIKILCLCIIGLFLLNLISVNANYHVTVGTRVHYDTMRSFWDYRVADNQSIGSGYNFEDVTYANDTALTIDVTSVDPLSVTYTETVTTVTNTDVDVNAAFSTTMLFMAYLPMLRAEFLDPWNQAYNDKGPGPFGTFFIDHISQFETFEDYSNKTYINENLVFLEDYIYNRINGHYNVTGDLAIFNWLLDCTSLGTDNLDFFSGNYTFQLAYDRQTSTIQGVQMYFNYSGLVDGYRTKAYLYHKMEIAGFDLPAFYFEVDVAPEQPLPAINTPLEYIDISVVSIIAFGSITIALIVITRRKLK